MNDKISIQALDFKFHQTFNTGNYTSHLRFMKAFNLNGLDICGVSGTFVEGLRLQ